MDRQMLCLTGGVFVFLSLASLVGALLSARVTSVDGKAAVANLNARINAWWVMAIFVIAAVAAGEMVTVVLFGLVSFLALREMITLTPTRAGDHRTLFWVFFIITPLQYYLVAIEWYGFFSIMIPVYAFLFIPLRSILAGDSRNFLERIAKIQWGLMICVYCVSHIPALLSLDVPGYQGQSVKLLVFLIVVAQISDVLQYVFGKTIGRRRVAPQISPNKTVEGFIGGILSATLLGAGLWWMTPFTLAQAAGMSLMITLLGFAGGLTMSAIKRDSGVKDYGNIIAGHGGMLDRMDSLCFAAPVFFHIVRFFFT